MPFTLSPLFRGLTLTVLTLCLCACQGFAQQFGGLAPGIDWRQINTDTCRIIFPQELTAEAQRVANAVHYLRGQTVDDIGDRSFKIDIVLNNQSTIANGSVSLAPWKSHFLTTPLQNNFALGAVPWLDLLAIHEYRHVTQLSTMRRGITKVLYFLFGQETWSGASNLSVPDWFLEGDAVWVETTMSKQGRGRTANFLKGYRALAQEGNLFPYRKARNGSIKDYVPDHYRLGYLMLKHGHENYGANFWKEVLADGSSFKGLFYPFSQAMKARSGLTTAAFYDEVMKSEGEVWTAATPDPDATEVFPQALRTFTNFLYPVPVEGDELIYFSQSFDRIGAFYRYDLRTDQRTELVKRGLSIEFYYGYNQGRLAWAELTTDPRWIETDYSNIILYDLSNQRRRKITKKGKYFSPQPNRTGTAIVAVHQGESAQSDLVIIDVASGTESQRLANPQRWVYTFPKWSPAEDEIIAAVRNGQSEMAIVSVSVTTGQPTVRVPFANVLIGAPWVTDDAIYYSASGGDVENIFRYDKTTGLSRQVTFEGNGAFNPAVSGQDLYYVAFSSMGHFIKTKQITATAPQRSAGTSGAPTPKSYSRDIVQEIPDRTFTTTSYPELAHVFNFHTWGFDFDDPLVTLRALSNNVLNNVEMSAGVNYNYDTEIFSPFARVTLSTFYPEISLEANTLIRKAVIERIPRKWRETNVVASMASRLNLSSGIYRRQLIPAVGMVRTLAKGDEVDSKLTSAFAQLRFVNQRLTARKNLFPRLGQFIEVGLSEALDAFQARQYRLRSALALPGAGPNHSLILHADYKKDLEDGDYPFTAGLSQRGLGVVPADEIWRLSANYHLPLVYPDWGFAGLFYIYRVQANLFYDYTYATMTGSSVGRSSTGVEVIFDLNLVNATNATLGVRFAHAIDGTTNRRLEVFTPVYRFE